ncbi:MAG: hypothetical protein UDM07_06255, partial [Adlercreutzia sp.]|nr:hypothetical protein [Adlercreutzia sp.]
DRIRGLKETFPRPFWLRNHERSGEERQKGLSVIQKRSFSQVAYYKKVSTTPIAPIFRDFQAKKELEVAKGT